MHKNNIGYDLLIDLKKIDKREKPPVRVGNVLKSMVKTVKGDKTSLKSSLGLDFEEKKLADKEKVILDYPFPETPEEMLLFAEFLKKMIANKNSTELLSTWRKKLNQLKLLIDSKYKDTDECAKINAYYQQDKRSQNSKNIRENSLFLYFMSIFFLAIIGCLIFSLISWSMVGVFFSILGFVEWFLGVFYIFGRFDKTLVYNKTYNKSKLIRLLCVVGWVALPFMISGWITAIIFETFVLLTLLSILLFAYILYLSHFSFRGIIWLLPAIVILCLILSITYSNPAGLFFSITALLYCPVLILHTFNLLNNIVHKVQKYINRKPQLKRLTLVIFLIIIPSISGLIVSIIFNVRILEFVCVLLILMEFLYTLYLYSF